MRHFVLTFLIVVAGCEETTGAQGQRGSALFGAVPGVIPDRAGAPAAPIPVGAVSHPAPEPTSLSRFWPEGPECGVVGGIHPDPLCNLDADGDGVVAKFDCDDHDATKSPLAADVRCNAVDENCNGQDECDADGDGVLAAWDCDDRNLAVGGECHHPFDSDRVETAR